MICLVLICITLLMDSRFYLDYIFNKKNYMIENAVITNIDFYPTGKSGSYQSSVNYFVENQSSTGNIRTAIGDYIGKEITIGVNKNDYSKIVPNKFIFERKTILHSIFMGVIFIYSIYLVIDCVKKRSLDTK